ncbi:mechanosensitive ion channel family protein [Paenibacillus terrigena]|uniref:mechanosensitive ion channel family protein n=1 Tax=Paenibacillus terrigena TaxID=369333 RepID=UPI0028D54C4F|nr:mechanosensitive ion channel family protein [Paenibacillus terrigena]
MAYYALAEETGEIIEQNLNWFQKKIWGPITNPDLWENMMWEILKVILIIIVCRVLIRVLHKAINHLSIKKGDSRLQFTPRRMITIGKLLKNVTTYVINFVMILMIISEWNIVDLRPILAGAGVLGLAIGFGAQSLVKDIITGFFIIFEDQFAVGDVIEVNTHRGAVEVIGLRSTRIQSWTGEVFIIPNGMINEVTNFSLHNSVAFIDISVAYEENVDEAIELMKKAMPELKERSLDMVKVPEVLGVQMMSASDVKIRIIAECKPYTQAGVARFINIEMKRLLDAHGIEIPYPRMVTYHRAEKEG